MQTTLRIDDRLYREAKAEAAREGLSLTRFLEQGLRMRLEKKMADATVHHEFRVYSADKPDSRAWNELCRVAEGQQEEHDFAKLGINNPNS